MEQVENTNTQLNTRSDLSDWSGTLLVTNQTPNDSVRTQLDKVASDHLDWTDRMYDFFRECGLTYAGDGYQVLGPASTPTRIFDLTSLFRESLPLVRALDLYDAFTWDAIEVTISLSNPKGISGGVAVGSYPFKQWYNRTFNENLTAYTLNKMTLQQLLLSPESQMISFSSAQDVKFTIPWQYPHPFIRTQVIRNVNLDSNTNRPIPGTPIFWYHILAANYVSSVSKPAQLRVYVRFKGLRFYAPYVVSGDGFQVLAPSVKQSGLEVAAGAIAVDAAINTGIELVEGALASANTDFLSEEYRDGSYEAPTAVQLAFAGDTTSVGPPPTSPMLFKEQRRGKKHPVQEYLSRPQWIGTTDTTAEYVVLYSNPVFPTGYKHGSDQEATYFRWFSQGNQYWRGTIDFDFLILGHPMVEVGYHLTIGYMPYSDDPNGIMSQCSVLKGIANGTTRLKVPMPFMTECDFFPIVDRINNNVSTRVNFYSASFVIAKFYVVSTMLDVDPKISVAMFMSAQPDFKFYQPHAIGMGHVESSALLAPSVKQISLPPVDVTMETRALEQLDAPSMIAMEYVDDYMRIWSRCLPFGTRSGIGEPVPDMNYSPSPAWWPMSNTEGASTLGVENSWYVTNDFISLYSSMYLLYRGSLGVKVLCTNSGEGDYKYLSMIDPNLWFRQPSHIPFTSNPSQMPAKCNFGYGATVTPLDKQPVIEVTYPYRSVFEWNYVNRFELDGTAIQLVLGEETFSAIDTNITLKTGDDLDDALSRKICDDYALAVECQIPPPTLWIAKGAGWEE